MFRDKSTANNILWSKVANQMTNMGYCLGDKDKNKVRQKFMNLQYTFMKYKDEIRLERDL